MGAFCPSCGSEVEVDWRFCYSCGAEQPVGRATEPAAPTRGDIARVVADEDLAAANAEAERLAEEAAAKRAEAERLAAERLAEVERQEQARREAAEAEAERQAALELERQAAAEREAALAAQRAAKARADAEAAAEAARRTAEEEALATIRAHQARAHAKAAADAEEMAAAAAQTVAAARAAAQAEADTSGAEAERARLDAEAAAIADREAAAELASATAEPVSSPVGFGSPESEIDHDEEAKVAAALAQAEPVDEASIWNLDPSVEAIAESEPVEPAADHDRAELFAATDLDTAADPTPAPETTTPQAEAAEPTQQGSKLVASSPLATRSRRGSRRRSDASGAASSTGYRFPDLDPLVADAPAAEPHGDLIPSSVTATDTEASNTETFTDEAGATGTYRPPGPTGRLAQKGLLLAAFLCLVTVGSLLRLNSILDGVLAGGSSDLTEATDAQATINNILLPLMAICAIGSYFLVGSWALTMHRNLTLVRIPSTASDRVVRWGLAVPVLNLVVGKSILSDLTPPDAAEQGRRTNPWILAWWVLSLAGLVIATVSLLNSAATVDQAAGANTWSAIGYGLLALSLLCCVVVVATMSYEHERWAADEFGLPRSLRPRYGVLQRLGLATPPEVAPAHHE